MWTPRLAVKTPFALAFILLEAAAAVQWEPVFLSDYKDAVCNDNSPAAYYFRASAEKSRVWLVFLEGGGWCWDSKTCSDPARKPYGTSRHYPKTRKEVDTWSQKLQGIFKADDAANPFKAVNVAYVRACSNDAFVGDRAPEGPGQGLFFKGRRIVEATFADLAKRSGMGENVGDRVILGGCSSGARGATALLDYVSTHLVGLANTVGLLDSGFWVPVDTTNDAVANFEEQTRQAFETFQTPDVLLGNACLQQYGAQRWKCLLPAYRLPFIVSSYFLSHSQYDLFAISTNLFGSFRPGEKLGWSQLFFAERYRNTVSKYLPKPSSDSGSTVFSSACYATCAMTSEFLHSAQAADVPLVNALRTWFAATSNKAATKWIRDDCKGFNCGQCAAVQAAKVAEAASGRPAVRSTTTAPPTIAPAAIAPVIPAQQPAAAVAAAQAAARAREAARMEAAKQQLAASDPMAPAMPPVGAGDLLGGAGPAPIAPVSGPGPAAVPRAANFWEPHFLEEHPLALCNDGSPAAYYFRRGAPQQRKWFVFLEGSSWCWDPTSCATEWAKEHGTSLKYPLASTEVEAWSKTLKGILAYGIKSPIEDWHVAFVRACTNDAFLGDTSPPPGGKGMHFRGRRVLEATFADLRRRTGLGKQDGDLVLFGGCGAGARGATVAIDTLAQSHVGRARLFGVLDAPIAVPIRPAAAGLMPFADQVGDVANSANISWPAGAECEQDHPGADRWKCFEPWVRIKYVRTPYLLTQSQYDSYGISLNLFGKPNPELPLSEAQKAYAEQYRQLISQYLPQPSPQSGNVVFAPACYSHCLLSDELFSSVDAGGVALTSILEKWLGLLPQHAAVASLHDTCKGFNCGMGKQSQEAFNPHVTRLNAMPGMPKPSDLMV